MVMSLEADSTSLRIFFKCCWYSCDYSVR